MELELDQDLHTRRARARGKPELRSNDGPESGVITADAFEAQLNPAGWIETFHRHRKHSRHAQSGPKGNDEFSAQQAQVADGAEE